MRTVLHVGMPKTGSTALQGCLQASHAPLAAQGVLYPANPAGCRFNNHRMLIFGFTPFADLPRHVRRYPEYTARNFRDKYAEFVDGLHRQVAEARPDWLVISSETLFRRLGKTARRNLAGALPPAEALTVAVYLRRPSEHYLSNLQQRLKNSYTVGPVWTPPVYAILGSYARAFGAGAVRPRVYARALLRDGDIVADFLASYLGDAGVDARGLLRGTNSNETVSAESMDLLRRYRLAFHPRSDNMIAEDSAALVRVLRREDRAAGAPKPRLRPDVAEAIDYARPDPLRLRDEYGLTFPDMDYRRFERVRLVPPLLSLLGMRWRRHGLADIVVIDRGVQRAILRNLRRSGWAKADATRQSWIAGLLSAPPD